MCIKTNVTDRKLVSSLHSAAALRQISKESFRTQRWPINVPSMKHIYSENTLYDGGCKKTGETFMKAESPVAAELLLVSVRNGCGSSRSWMSDLSGVQDAS